MRNLTIFAGIAVSAFAITACDPSDFNLPVSIGHGKNLVSVGPRPLYLVGDMDDSPLKAKLASCAYNKSKPSLFSIGHRGAAMQFPEHTKESYKAAAHMGAGIVECDVTFTKDKELVCRHSQCDLHTTTNILKTPLANKCNVPPVVDANGVLTNGSDIKCCTSDITLAEFKTLKGKMDGANKAGKTIDEYMDGTANWRTDLYSQTGTLMTHAESIQLFQDLGVKMTPELKSASVPMPYDGFSQEDYAQKMIDEYKAAQVPAEDVWAQSFNLDDVKYWIKKEPAFGAQAVYLDDEVYKNSPDETLNQADYQKQIAAMPKLYAEGVRYIAPPMYTLVELDDNKNIVPSEYAHAANAAGLNLVTWTIERSGPLANGGGWYYQTITDAINNDGDMYNLLDVLAKDVGVKGVFSDWPATTTYYANCMGLE